MGAVPVSIIQSTLAVSERYGIPRAALLGHGALKESDLGRRRRIGWDAFCEFNDRVEQAWAPHGGLEAFGRAFSTQPPPEWASLARSLIPPRQFLRLLFKVGEWAHPFATVTVRDVKAHALEVDIALPKHLRDNPSFFRICAATMRWSIALIGYPPLKVGLTVSPHRGTYRFWVPHSKTVFHRAQTAADARFSLLVERIEALQSEVRELLSRHAAHHPDVPRARAQTLGETWGLSPRQVEVLQHLAHGASNREIAKALGVAERTVEVHVSELLKRAGVDARARLVARFWAAPA